MATTKAGLVVLAGVAAALAGLAAPGALAADRSEKGMTLVIPADQAARGKAYYALLGKDAQVTFTSDAPLEHIRASSNKVVGYAVVNNPATGPIIEAAEFKLPLDSFDTGIPMRNEHLKSDQWMDAKTYPDVDFTMSAFKDAKIEKEGEGFKTWAGTLVGKMTIKGTTKEMSIPAKITLRPESAETKARAPGDLMAIRCAYSVKLSDFGVNNPLMKSGKVSDQIDLETFIMMSTVNPETLGPPPGAGKPGEKPAEKAPEKPKG